MKKLFVSKGDYFPRVALNTENILIIPLKEERYKIPRKVAIVGPSYSIQLDETHHVNECDPFLPNSNGLLKYFPEFSHVYLQYFPFSCKGLAEAGQVLAKFINKELKHADSIMLIGHSKSGLCFLNAFQWLTETLQKKTLVCSITTPYKGCITVNKEAITARMNGFERMVYEKIFSNHPVDQDMIAGSEFLKNLYLPDWYRHINFMSSFRGKMTIDVPADLLLFLLDKRLKINGGGVVSETSQALDVRDVFLHCSDAASTRKALEWLKRNGKL